MKKFFLICSFLFLAITALVGYSSSADNRNVSRSVSIPTSIPTDDSLVDNVSDFSKTEVSGTSSSISIENPDKKVAILRNKLVQYDNQGNIVHKSPSLKYLGQKPELSCSDSGELFLVTYDKPHTKNGGMYIYVFDKKLSKVKLLLRGITVCHLADGTFYDSNRNKAWKYTQGKLKEIPYSKASDFSETKVSGTSSSISIENSDKKVAILRNKLVQYDNQGNIVHKSQSLKYLGQKPELFCSDSGELFLVTYDKPHTKNGGMYIYVFNKKLSKVKLLLRGITVCNLADGTFYDSNRNKAWKYTQSKLKEIPYSKN